MGDSSKSADEDAVTALMLDLMSLGAGSSARGSGIADSQQRLHSWHPWTNSVHRPRLDLPGEPPRSRHAGRIAAAPASATIAPTTKAAGGIYDSMLRAKQSPACHGTNNSTWELEGGLKDVQTHTGGGHRTTIITRLGSATGSGGGVVDFNFVMDTVSTNNSTTDPGAQKVKSYEFDDMSKSDATWMLDIRSDAWKQQQHLLHSKRLNAGMPQSETANPGSDSSDDSPKLQQRQQPKKRGPRRKGEDSASTLTGDSQDSSPLSVLAGPLTSESEGDDLVDNAEEGEGEGGEAQEINDEEEQPAQDEKQGRTSSRKKLSMSHLQKEGVLIGCMNVFADVMKKEFVVLLTDRVVEAFLLEPSQLRAIARRTGCEIEVTRRILNKRISTHRWVKYLVLTIKGPNMLAISQCDRLMVKVFPPYKMRKEYLESAHVSLFVKESYPDNTKLYFNFQRTGPTRVKLGDLRLQTPFDSCRIRPLEHTPWKYADWRLFKGVLEPRNLAAEHTIQHVYPEWGTEIGNYIEEDQKWEKAGDVALDIEKKKNLERSLRVKARKMEAEPLFAEEN